MPVGDAITDFSAPFQRKTPDELLAEHTGVDPCDASAVKAYAESLNMETAGKHPGAMTSEVFEEKVQDYLVRPILAIEYPASFCPLAKRKAGGLN